MTESANEGRVDIRLSARPRLALRIKHLWYPLSFMLTVPASEAELFIFKTFFPGYSSRFQSKPPTSSFAAWTTKKRKHRKTKTIEDIAEDGEGSHLRPSKKAKIDEGLEATNQTPEDDSMDQTPSQEKSTAKPSITASIKVPFGDLANSHDVLPISVISSSQIEKKVNSVLNHLKTFPAIPPVKLAVVMVYSKAKSASKLITIIEIAKREIGSNGGKWFQYNVIDQVKEPRENTTEKQIRKPADTQGDEGKSSIDADPIEEPESDNGEQSFETMKTPFERAIEGKLKIRAVPIMTIYLSRVRIESLKSQYGEQTNGR
ncbi:hypothetical protein G7Y89_g13741 [Cudoniella acicularis]|uniref:DNA/RNA-binding protein Alba-like domain-containing protein n=1 Tax=Cudoniella acicularis TaxID=354080 RepID=A0A8H4RA28_9HELO|nr:hypothetical protein G7Y89_g13741 [Cudoniella acicularis]